MDVPTLAVTTASAAVVAWLVARTVATRRLHHARHETAEAAAQRPLRCGVCDDPLGDRREAREHMAERHNMTLDGPALDKVLAGGSE